MERELAVESMFPVLDPISRNYPTRKGEVGVGFHTKKPFSHKIGVKFILLVQTVGLCFFKRD
jgi:hypothetical protein